MFTHIETVPLVIPCIVGVLVLGLYPNICFFRIIDVLRDFGRSDWQLASMVCQTLWNYSGKITSANAYFGEAEANELVELLLEYLGEFVEK